VLRNAYVERWQGHEAEIGARRDALQAEVTAAEEREDITVAGISAGVSAGLITATEPAGEIVRRIAREAEELLRQRPAELLASV
jgi:hypothetical protein